MVDAIYMPAIKETIKQNEIGDGTPYALGYAEKDKSGASFGVMQGDTNANPLARDTLNKVLVASGAGDATVSRIMAAVSRPLPHGNPLSAADTKLANAALAAPKGMALVDAMDNALLVSVVNGVDTCITAAQGRDMELQPIALLYIAPWVNMSGAPSLLKKWLAGAGVMGLQPPDPPEVTAEEMEAYLQATAYFQANPRNFVHYQQCVAKGAALLPQPAVA